MDQKIEKRFKNTAKSKTFNNIIRIFELDKKSVLDIGCSFGEFTIHFGKGSAGITISKEEAEYGIKRGLDIRYGNIESNNFELSEKYDVIFANNLLEHLYSPHNFLCKIKKYLKPEGILILGAPCIPKITSLLKLNKFSGSLSVAHINFFTRDTLIKTVERAGWKLVAARGFHLYNKNIDCLLNSFYPHFYAVARINLEFKHSEKRISELSVYFTSI